MRPASKLLATMPQSSYTPPPPAPSGVVIEFNAVSPHDLGHDLFIHSGNPEPIVIDWGDGNSTNVPANLSSHTSYSHTYSAEGFYDIEVRGKGHVVFAAAGNASKITKLKRFGTLFIPTSASWAFAEARNMIITATDAADFDMSNVTQTSSMFYFCNDLTSNGTNALAGLDMSTVTNMSGMFNRCYVFNDDLSGWNVANVTSYSYYDDGATAWQASHKPIFV